ncbi:aspartate/glutamate racemase family protein [Tianweitania populi]|uniref:Asp/Glu racemase n=1 Tax=Tianweitania populi TaxID=1607949 RepID=A0A8J3DTU1_9HYPH|nr:aspartate/glutamate racemase family protein [Tianweitania populi]GHD05280.1 Asp/Glu racemase [Tianweitania populi]
MKKVLVIVPFPMGEEDLARRQAQMKAVDLGPGIEFHYKAVRVGPKNYSSQHDMVLADISIVDAGLDAEKDGFDAVCIDTMSDSGMAMLRSVLTIPVIAPGRHAMLVAQMLGEKFSILMMWDRWKMLYTKTLGELGMEHKCASMRSIGVTPDNKSLLSGKEEEVFPLLLDAARKCVEEDGAQVLILGSTTMHEAHGWLSKQIGVPVINPGPLTYKLASIAVDLKLTHSKATWPTPLAPKHEMIRAIGAAGAAYLEGRP